MPELTITLAAGGLTPESVVGDAALYDTIPVTVTGLVATPGHTYIAILSRRSTYMGGTDTIAESVAESGVVSWTFDLPLTHSALLAACVGAAVKPQLALWDATDGRHVFRVAIDVQYAPEPDGWVSSDPAITAATVGQIVQAIAAHDASGSAHPDIRDLISEAGGGMPATELTAPTNANAVTAWDEVDGEWVAKYMLISTLKALLGTASYLTLAVQAEEPATPSAGNVVLWCSATGLYIKDAAGNKAGLIF